VSKPLISIVVGTYNRLNLLQNLIYSIFSETRTPFLIYIIDSGSSDGTIEYLKLLNSEKIILISEGAKNGQSVAYNKVFRAASTKYIAWLSDDNYIVNGSIDSAVRILMKNEKIGMVGLKVKDVVGPFTFYPYIGGISHLGVLNVNQGVLRRHTVLKMDGFDENLKDYGIDPDITKRVINLGYKVVYTKSIGILHYRQWSEDPLSNEFIEREKKIKKSLIYYQEKFGDTNFFLKLIKSLVEPFLVRIIKFIFGPRPFFLKYIIFRDFYNIFKGRYISLLDPLRSRNKSYHLIQDPESIFTKIYKKIKGA